MAWVGSSLAAEEAEAFERIWPEFRATLERRGKTQFEVRDLTTWIQMRPRLGITPIEGDRGKTKARESSPGTTIVNTQNALYHSSANSAEFVITDTERPGRTVTLLQHVDDKTYRLIPEASD